MNHVKRDPDSHKGQNGKVAIIGGSAHMHGAPIIAALAAERAGADLIFPYIPKRHYEVTKAASLNFMVHHFIDDELSAAETTPILELLATMDCALMGPGLDRSKAALKAIATIIDASPCPLVLDASALQAETVELLTHPTVLTPHRGELERMGLTKDQLPEICKTRGCTILVKDVVDTIYSSDGKSQEVSGGNAGLTVGGTGDALSGLTAGLIAQGVDHAQACLMASTVIKRAGTKLFHDFGYAYRAADVIEQIPNLLHALDD